MHPATASPTPFLILIVAKQQAAGPILSGSVYMVEDVTLDGAFSDGQLHAQLLFECVEQRGAIADLHFAAALLDREGIDVIRGDA